MIVIEVAGMSTHDGGSERAPFKWTPHHRDALDRAARDFKQQDDLAGVHLCAMVEDEARQYEAAGDGACPARLLFYMALIESRANDGADHELAHILLPQIVELMVEGRRRAALDELKREAGIDG